MKVVAQSQSALFQKMARPRVWDRHFFMSDNAPLRGIFQPMCILDRTYQAYMQLHQKVQVN